MRQTAFTFSIIVSMLISSGTLALNSSPPMMGKALDSEATMHYWTSERLRDAKPFSVEVKWNTTRLEAAPVSNEKPQSGRGSPPTIDVKPVYKKLFEPIIRAAPFNVGASSQVFSSSQIVPQSSDAVYPYRTVGKIFFTSPTGNFYCSAATIGSRIVLTGGHCVHSGQNGNQGFFTNFLFVPAIHNGAAQFGKWTGSFVTATSIWINGGGTTPNASDIGMIEVQDQTINGIIRRLGDVVGFLGWQTQSLKLNHIHSLGFPNNFDNGNVMHQVAAQSGIPISPNNVQIGSDMHSGSGGGPWVQNFGIPAAGQSSGNNPGFNMVVGVTSNTVIPTTQLAQISSILDSNFTNLLTSICNHQANNCS